MSDTPRVDAELVNTKAAVRNFPELEKMYAKYESVRDLARELERELIAVTKWQPIATAPRGYGNNILLWVKGSRPWVDYLRDTDMSDAQCRRSVPTHWMPLSQPPEE